MGCGFVTANCEDYPYSCSPENVNGCSYDYQAEVCIQYIAVLYVPNELYCILYYRLSVLVTSFFLTVVKSLHHILKGAVMDFVIHLEVYSITLKKIILLFL